MSESFEGLRVYKDPYEAKLESRKMADLSGEVLIRAKYSSLNYKDALALTGKGKILKSFPLTPGIDVAGTLEDGSEVIVTGCGLGEEMDGGYAEYVKVPSSSVIPLPEGLTLRESMILGTAGFTAALCVHRLLVNDQTKDKGPILITGASGGVGMISVDILSSLGFEVWAMSGKSSAKDFLLDIGAAKVFQPDELEFGSRPLEKGILGGAIDNVGGETLSAILRHVALWGNVASVGLASGASFSSTVMPHILRGVSLLGISSNNTPRALREKLWQDLAGPHKPKHLDKIVSKTIGLSELPEMAEEMIQRKTQGRILIEFS